MNEPVTNLLWIAFGYLCGALPLSYWLGKVFLHVDIRQYGDGNPGGANVWKAGGKWWGLTAIIMDGFKGLIPVALANFQGGVTGWALVAVCLAPILGHAYTPFLGFKDVYKRQPLGGANGSARHLARDPGTYHRDAQQASMTRSLAKSAVLV